MDLDNPDADNPAPDEFKLQQAKRAKKVALWNFVKGIVYLFVYLGVGCWYYNRVEVGESALCKMHLILLVAGRDGITWIACTFQVLPSPRSVRRTTRN